MSDKMPKLIEGEHENEIIRVTDNPHYYRNKMRELRASRKNNSPFRCRKRVWILQVNDDMKLIFLSKTDMEKCLKLTETSNIDLNNDSNYVFCY